MGDVFRILDRFRITGGGMVYTIKKDAHSIIRVGDILYDLWGNHFKVGGIEVFRKVPDGKGAEGMLLGLMFERMDGVGAEGNVLVRSLGDVNFLFCNHPLYPKRVDGDYEEEFQAAGLEHACALFSYENLEAGKLSLYGEDVSGLAIYRGWMMKPGLYRVFYNKLEEKGIILINTPEEYERYHMLPGWYSDFQDDTARSVWEDQGTVDSALLLARGLEGSYIVKDYVKSRKHEWYDACFVNNIADKANAERIIRNFVERQDSDLVGGVVLRQFEKLKPMGFHEKSGMPISEEYRVFAFAGRIMIIDAYWQDDKKASFSEEEHRWIEASVKKLKSNFVTMDIARREDGKLIIMELGDGQVSGLLQIKPADFYRAFHPDVPRLGGGWKSDNEKTVYIMMGIQGSGKSTFCSRYLSDIKRVNLDTLHTRNKEALLIEECQEKGCDYVVDNTNPTREDRARYILAAEDAGYRVIGYFMQSRLQECIKRNNLRKGKERIPSKAIAMTSNKLEMPSYAEGFDELYFVKNDGESMSICEWREDDELR